MDKQKLLKKPCIHRRFFVVPISPDEVQIRESVFENGEIHHLYDKNKEGKLLSIIYLFDGVHTVDEIAKITHTKKEDIYSLIRYLKDNGLLEEKKLESLMDRGDVLGIPSSILRHIKIWEAFSSKIGIKNITVIGASRIGLHLIFQLIRMGVKNIVVGDNSTILQDDNDTIWTLNIRKEEIGLPTREIIKDRIHNIDPSINIITKSYDLSEDDISELTKNSNHVIIADEFPQILLYSIMNKVALKNNITWSILNFDGLKGNIGPTFIPNETACYTCYELRARSCLSNQTQYDIFKNFLLANKTTFIRYNKYIYPSFADVISGIFALDIPEIINLKSGFTVGRAYTVSTHYFSIEGEDILKLPRCPTCGKRSRDKTNFKLFDFVQKIL